MYCSCCKIKHKHGHEGDNSDEDCEDINYEVAMRLKIERQNKWYEVFVFSEHAMWYQVINFFITILCLMSSYMYLFMAAFRLDQPKYFHHLWDAHWVIEFIFFIYIFLQFFKEYKPEY